jgi:hypothetical protein
MKPILVFGLDTFSSPAVAPLSGSNQQANKPSRAVTFAVLGDGALLQSSGIRPPDPQKITN